MNEDGRTPIFNPDSEAFEVQYDINGDGNPRTFRIGAKTVQYFDSPIAAHVTKHLANKIFHKRGIKNNPEMDLADIRREITEFDT